MVKRKDGARPSQPRYCIGYLSGHKSHWSIEVDWEGAREGLKPESGSLPCQTNINVVVVSAG